MEIKVLRTGYENCKTLFFTGKGTVGKTTYATNIALGLIERGAKVHLTTTDPTNHLNYDLAERLQADLQRAGINNKWWVVNSCLSLVKTQNPFLQAKAQSELPWIERVKQLSSGNTALAEWENL